MTDVSDELMEKVVREAETLRDSLIPAGFVFELDRWFNHNFEAHKIEMARGMGATEKVEITTRAVMDKGEFVAFFTTVLYRIFPTGNVPVSMYTKEFSAGKDSILDQVESCRKDVTENYPGIIDWDKHREALSHAQGSCACCGDEHP